MSNKAVLGFFLFSRRLEPISSLCGGSFPHRLGYFSSLIPPLRREDFIPAHPWLHSTRLLPPFSIPPPTTTSTSFPSQIHHVQVKHITTDLDPIPLPPNHRSLLCHLVGVSSLTGSLFLPPQPCHHLLTAPTSAHCPLKFPTPIATVSSSAERPPPEPPPLDKGDSSEGSMRSRKLRVLLSKASIGFPPSVELGPIRPPPKPPDAGKSFNLSNVVAAGSSVGAFLCMLVLRLGCVKYAPGVFDGKPQQIWAFLENIVHTGPYEADNYFCILSKYQSASKQRVNLDNVETTFSRNEPEKDKEMILNWIVEKTVDSHFLDVFDRVWKIMIGQLLGSRYGFSFAHLVSVQSMCNVAHVSIGLAVRGETSLWMGNAPTQPDQSLCIDLYFI